jgi:hypothetical protein
LRFDDGGVMTPVQAPTISLVALEIAAVDWRFASAVILARAVLATEWAPLSHMLRNGFFFSQGFDTYHSSSSRAAAYVVCLEKRGVGSTPNAAVSPEMLLLKGWSDPPRGAAIGPCGSRL